MRVVDLEKEPGLYDCAIFFVQCVSHGEDEVFVRLIVFIQPVGDDTAGCDRSHERFRHVGTDKCCSEVVDILSDHIVPPVGNGAGARPIPFGADKTLRLVVFRVKLREALAVSPFCNNFAYLKSEPSPLFEAGEPIEDVTRPARRLAELAVANDINARACLLVHDLGHRSPQPIRIGARCLSVAGVYCLQVRDELRRPDKAARMCGQDFCVAVFHGQGLVSDFNETGGRHRRSPFVR